MSEWINHVKAYAEKNNIRYKKALKMHPLHIKQEMKRNLKKYQL